MWLKRIERPSLHSFMELLEPEDVCWPTNMGQICIARSWEIGLLGGHRSEVFEPKLEADRKREIISKTFRVPDGVDSSSHNTSLWMKRSVHSKMNGTGPRSMLQVYRMNISSIRIYIFTYILLHKKGKKKKKQMEPLEEQETLTATTHACGLHSHASRKSNR